MKNENKIKNITNRGEYVPCKFIKENCMPCGKRCKSNFTHCKNHHDNYINSVMGEMIELHKEILFLNGNINLFDI